MKKIIILISILICSVSVNAQLNILTSQVYGRINMTTVKTLCGARLIDTVKNNQFDLSKTAIGRINKQFKRVFGQSYLDSLSQNGYTNSLDTNVVKYYYLIFSNDFYKKYEASVRLRAEYEISVNNLRDSTCIAASRTGLKVGVLSLKENTTGIAFLVTADSVASFRVDLKSVVRATAIEKRVYGGRVE